MKMEFVPVNVYYPYIGQVILKIYQFSGVLIQRRSGQDVRYTSPMLHRHTYVSVPLHGSVKWNIEKKCLKVRQKLGTRKNLKI